MLNAVSGEDLDAAVIELDGDVNGEFLGRGTEHLTHTVVQLEPLRSFVKARGGGEPGILFVFEGNGNRQCRRGHSRASEAHYYIPQVKSGLS